MMTKDRLDLKLTLDSETRAAATELLAKWQSIRLGITGEEIDRYLSYVEIDGQEIIYKGCEYGSYQYENHTSQELPLAYLYEPWEDQVVAQFTRTVAARTERRKDEVAAAAERRRKEFEKLKAEFQG